MYREGLEPPALPEHFPTVVVEVAACEGIADIDINLHRVSKWLSDKGLTPQQIDDTKVVLSAKQERDRRATTRGRYDRKTKSALVYPVLQTRKYTQRYYDEDSDDLIDFDHKNGGDVLGMTLDAILQHEFEHRVVHVEGGMPENDRHEAQRERHVALVSFGWILGSGASICAKEATLPSQSSWELGATALTLTGAWFAGAIKAINAISRKAYWTNPEENRARAAVSDDWKHSFFTVRLDYQNQPIRTR